MFRTCTHPKMGSLSSDAPVHAVLFPFMSKGHTIPILHLARLLLRRSLAAAVTVFTTPSNLPFVSRHLAGTPASAVSLPFPGGISGLPSGVESTDALPSMSLFPAFASATALLQPSLEAELQRLHPQPTFMVSDGFLWWTLESASKFGIPRLVFYGISNYAMVVSRAVAVENHLRGPMAEDEPFALNAFPWIKVTKNDFERHFSQPSTEDTPLLEFVMKTVVTMGKSNGLVVNSFKELEPAFLEYWNSECVPRAWCIGPLFPLERPVAHDPHVRTTWAEWLDRKQAGGERVLYAAFGSQAEMPAAQLREIAIGLERSGASFLWVVKSRESEIVADVDGGFKDRFEDRVRGRGMVVREWVDQRDILMHESVHGFLSHCGWNSVLESMCAGVPILAWPMMAEQPLNARMVAEEIGVGLRVEAADGTVRGFVSREGLAKAVNELMEGDRGEAVRKKVKEVAAMARKAAEEGGSSWTALETLVEEISGKREDPTG
ncbi:UDP-glycosyltransferase 90A1-like [Rhodamnia argentea]|uniref:Glycosyltransferase n=1 Tax=Rhodamnia argentea TaxID=178133 RepID=A0A8B8R2M5_9MYRT|nr:UDP-glycosyltransferase 90A1-like [Rhodamnia argentea]